MGEDTPVWTENDALQQLRNFDLSCSDSDASDNLRETALRIANKVPPPKDIWHTRIQISLSKRPGCMVELPYTNRNWFEILRQIGWTNVEPDHILSIDMEDDITCIGCLDIRGSIRCWRGLGLSTIPGSWTHLRVSGLLDLSHNNLACVPDLTIGGDLMLANNNLVNIGRLHVGGSVVLSYNKIKTWPANLSRSSIGQDLHLDNNLISEIPSNIDDMILVPGVFSLSHNQLKNLPTSLKNFTIGGNFHLEGNLLGNDLAVLEQTLVGGNIILDEEKYGCTIFKKMDVLFESV